MTVFDVGRPSEGLSITKELRRRIGRLAVLQNHHAYVESRGWMDDRSLRVIVWGYGESNPDGFDREYVFGLDGGVRVVRSRNTVPSAMKTR